MSSDFLPCFVMGYSDSSFTNPHEVVLPDDPPDCMGNFTHMGAKYWGFETKRHKATTVDIERSGFRFDHNAHHWLQLGLKAAAVVKRITISTKWFTGNQVPEVSVNLIRNGAATEILARTRLAPDSEHTFDIQPTDADECFIRCFHEGGIARVNLFGDSLTADKRINLLEAATISHVSNEHYGKPADAVAGNREVDYMLGWESARTGFGEQALFRLSTPATITELVVDTYMHRLNPPLSCHVFALASVNGNEADAHMANQPRWSLQFDDGSIRKPENFQQYMLDQSYLDEDVENPDSFNIRLINDSEKAWRPLVSFGQLYADRYHRFTSIEFEEPVSHILYMHYPNGGIHGLKAFGNIGTPE